MDPISITCSKTPNMIPHHLNFKATPLTLIKKKLPAGQLEYPE